MLDLYIIIVPVLAIVALLSLITLKLAIKDNVVLMRIFEKSLETYQSHSKATQETSTASTLKYFLLNFTPI